jgi:hypothetical protein
MCFKHLHHIFPDCITIVSTNGTAIFPTNVGPNFCANGYSVPSTNEQPNPNINEQTNLIPIKRSH